MRFARLTVTGTLAEGNCSSSTETTKTDGDARTNLIDTGYLYWYKNQLYLRYCAVGGGKARSVTYTCIEAISCSFSMASTC